MQSKRRKINKTKTFKRKLKNSIKNQFGKDWSIRILIPLFMIILILIIVVIVINIPDQKIRLTPR